MGRFLKKLIVSHGETFNYIGVVGTEDNDALVYINGYQKENGRRTCLKATRKMTLSLRYWYRRHKIIE